MLNFNWKTFEPRKFSQLRVITEDFYGDMLAGREQINGNLIEINKNKNLFEFDFAEYFSKAGQRHALLSETIQICAV